MVGKKKIGRPREDPARSENVRQFRSLKKIELRTENLSLRNRVIPSAKRRRNTIDVSSNYDVDYNDNNDYGSPIRFPRRVSPVLRSTSLMSLDPDPNDYVDDPEDAVYHTPESSHLLSYEASINTLSNLSISSNQASNFENSTEIDDHVHYSIHSKPSSTQLQQHDNHEVQDSIQGYQSPEASHSFPHDTTKSLPPNQNLIHCELPSWLGDLNDEKMNNRKMLEPEFNDDDSDESTLSDVNDDDASSGYSSAEGDDDEYENIQEYYARILGNHVAVKAENWIYITRELMFKFWEDVIALKETRKNIIKELKQKLKKPRKFSAEDVVYFKEIISSIELWLNKFIPAISKLRATFILGSNKCHVLFQGYKYSRTRQDPSRYKCTYNADPSAENFDYSLDNCLGFLELDEKGYLQPRSYIRHFHDPVKNGDFDQNLAEHAPANFGDVTREGKSITNQKKFNHFLAEMLQQALKYNEDALKIKSREQVIEDQLKKLKLLNDSYEEEENYIPSFIEWIQFFRIHVRIGDVRKLNKSVLPHRSDLIAESIHTTLKSNEVVRQSALNTLDMLENDKRFVLYKNKWWICSKEGFDSKKANVKDIMENICIKFMKENALVKNVIGKGCFGQASLMNFKGCDTEFIEKVEIFINDPEALIAEAITYSQCDDHKYIPKMIYCGYNADGKWCTIMEYVNGGTLLYHIQNSHIPENGKQTIAYQLALALEYLHEKNLTHGDLKPDNIALTLTGHVRLLDFGHSRDVSIQKVLPFTPFPYSAPEVRKYEVAGLAADRWSYGVVVAHLILRRHPFNDNMEMKEFVGIKTCGQPNLEGIQDEAAKELIKGLLQLDPNDRLNDISKHRYFNGVEEKDPPFKPVIIQNAGYVNKSALDSLDGFESARSELKETYDVEMKMFKNKVNSNEFVELHPLLQKYALKIPSKAQPCKPTVIFDGYHRLLTVLTVNFFFPKTQDY